MWRLGLDTIGLGIVIIMLVSLMFAVLILQRQRSQKTIAVWLAASLIGILLGSAGTLGALRLSGYRQFGVPGRAGASGSIDAGTPPGGSVPAGSMAGMGAGMGGGMGGGMMGAGMMGGGSGPNPKRDLTTLVRKLDLLTGGIGIQLTAEQGASLTGALADVEKAEDLSDDDAKAKHDAILALLDDAQESQLDAIGLPRPQRGAGGGPGGPPQEPPANPFQSEANASSLQNLRNRFAAAETKSETAPPAAKE